MAESVYIRPGAHLNLVAEKATLERRAEMAAQCECLAAWDDERECVCNTAVEVPLSLDKLKEAHDLAGKLKDVESRIERVKKVSSQQIGCHVILGHHWRSDGRQGFVLQQGDGDFVHHSGGDYFETINVSLPRAVILAALNDERHRLLDQLAQTGIVSVDQANIRSAPR